MSDNVLEITDLTIAHKRWAGRKTFLHSRKTETGYLVRDINLIASRNKVHGIVGESGSGKTLTAKTLLGLVDTFPGIISGNIKYYNSEHSFNLGSTTQDEKRPRVSVPRVSYSFVSVPEKIEGWEYLEPLGRDYQLSVIGKDRSVWALKPKNGQIDKKSILNHLKELEPDRRVLLAIRYVTDSTYSSARERTKIERILKEKNIRGQEIAMILQDPHTFLNPYWSIGKQVKNRLVHGSTSRRNRGRDSEQLAEEGNTIFRSVDLENARFIKKFPKSISGGQGQRVMLAMALAANPKLLIADEPTTGLDVTKQAEVIELFKDKVVGGLSIILISHDINFVRHLADEYTIVYAGYDLEHIGRKDLLAKTKLHPYTERLIDIGEDAREIDPESGVIHFKSILNEAPDPYDDQFHGCPYVNRCDSFGGSHNKRKKKICSDLFPPLIDAATGFMAQLDKRTRVDDKHLVRCWKYFKGNSNA